MGDTADYIRHMYEMGECNEEGEFYDKEGPDDYGEAMLLFEAIEQIAGIDLVEIPDCSEDMQKLVLLAGKIMDEHPYWTEQEE